MRTVLILTTCLRTKQNYRNPLQKSVLFDPATEIWLAKEIDFLAST